MVTHSSILAWEIPWTEEPGGLQSMGWQKSQIQCSELNNNNNHKGKKKAIKTYACPKHSLC